MTWWSLQEFFGGCSVAFSALVFQCSWESVFFSCPYSFIEYTKYLSTQRYRLKRIADITTRIRTNVANLSGLICSNFWHFVPYIRSWKSTSCSKIPTHCPCWTEEWAQISSTLVPGQFRMKCTSGRTHPLPLGGQNKGHVPLLGLLKWSLLRNMPLADQNLHSIQASTFVSWCDVL